MDSEDNPTRGRGVREKIAGLMQSIDQPRRKLVAGEELEKLKQAAGRLDQMLHAAEDADRQELRNAADRLDQMLARVRAEKTIRNGLKQRSGSQNGRK